MTIVDVDMIPKDELAHERDQAVERARLSAGIVAGVQYELERVKETRVAYDAHGDDAMAVLRRAALALDDDTSADAMKALEHATANAQFYKDGAPLLDETIREVRATLDYWTSEAQSHLDTAVALGAKNVPTLDGLLATLRAEGTAALR